MIRDLRIENFNVFLRMRQHMGMRPQDIVVLLKIIADKKKQFLLKDLASELFISPSEMTESIHRSQVAGLLRANKSEVNKLALLDFLAHGLPYVFPAVPGSLVNGVPTAFSHQKVKQNIKSETKMVWPDDGGTILGQSIQPLYPKQVLAVAKDAQLHFLLALVDLLRVGNVRDKSWAMSVLKSNILDAA